MSGPCSFATESIATAATAAAAQETRELPAWETTRVVGAAVPRVDAHERVSGSAIFTRDLVLPGMLHCVIVRSPHAHARVKRIDASRALSMPGVHAVITCDSTEASIPWHVGSQGALSRLLDPECRYEGDEVAAVAAETQLQAHDAARAVAVEYEPLPFVVDYEEALRPDAPKVHPFGNRVGKPRLNERGDLAAGFAAADATIERTFRTSCELHTPMETHCSVAQWDGASLQVWDSTQGVYAIREELAQTLKLPLASVRVSSRYMGGGFGGKLDLGKYTVIAAILARMTGRPVKAALSREETMRCVGNRPANTITIKAGAKKDGTLTALDARLVGGVGAFPAGATSGYLVLDLYTCANVRVEEVGAMMNAGQARAFRAPGFPQTAWALEQVIDELAGALGLDPVVLRLKNIPSVSQLRGGQPYTSTGLADCLRNGSSSFGWAAAKKRARGNGHVRRGVGVAAGMWAYVGDPTATAIVTLYADGSANVNSGAADIGTGTRTILAQVVAEELGVPIGRIQVEMADTATTQFAPSSGGSQTVLVNMPAVRSAAVAVKHELLSLAATELGKELSSLTLRDGAISIAGDATSVPITELKTLARRQQLVGVGKRAPHPEGKVALPFAAHFAEVEVNTRTGAVKVVRYLAAQDSGRVMNPLTYENQVLGGVTMGIGFGLTERRVLDRNTGKLVTEAWQDYEIPSALEFPADFTCLPVDPHDKECNSVGAKGLGEPATIPAAAAIANAIRDAIGVRILDAPITASAIVKAFQPTRS